ncbi:hypothetical protein D3C76_773690 [compost metagenome]
MHGRHVGEVGRGRRRGIDHAGHLQDDAAPLGNVDVGAVGGAQLAANDLETHAAIVGGAVLVQHTHQRDVAELGRQVIEQADVEGREVTGSVTVADGDREADGVALVIAAVAGGCRQCLADLQGGFAHDHRRSATGECDRAIHRHIAVGGVAVRVAVDQLRVVLPGHVGLVADDVVGHQLQAYHEGVVARLVVGRHAGHAEGPARIHTIVTHCAAQSTKTTDQHAAGEVRAQGATAGAGGDDLVTQAAVERGIQAHARRDQVVDAQVLRAAFGQGDHDVVAHAFADHQVAAGGVAGAGIAIVQRAIGIPFANDRRGDLLAGEVGEVGRGEVGAAIDAGVIAQGRGGLQGTTGLDGIADRHVVADHHQIGATGVGGGAAAPGEERGLAAGVEEGDLVAAHAVVGTQHQQGAVTPVDLQVRCRQAAADKAQSGRQGDVGADIEGAATAAVFDSRDQAQPIAAVDIDDIAVYGRQAGDAAIEGHAGAARRVPAAGRVADGAVGAGDHAVLDIQHRLGHGHNHRDVGGNQRTVGEGGLLA